MAHRVHTLISGAYGMLQNGDHAHDATIAEVLVSTPAQSIAGGAQTTALTMDNAALSNARNAAIKFTGTITGNQVVTVPNGIEKVYILENGTTGAFTVQFKTVSGTGPTWATVDKGIKVVYSNGTNVIDVNANLSASSFEQVDILEQGELRLQDAAGGQYVGFKSPTTVTTNTIINFIIILITGTNWE
jgi:hypothetical protein